MRPGAAKNGSADWQTGKPQAFEIVLTIMPVAEIAASLLHHGNR